MQFRVTTSVPSNILTTATMSERKILIQKCPNVLTTLDRTCSKFCVENWFLIVLGYYYWYLLIY